MDEVDIWVKGQVISEIQELAQAGQVKECVHLKVREGYLGAFYPECRVKFAARVPAENVPLDELASDAPSSYDWPSCPNDCPQYRQVHDFIGSLASDEKDPSVATRNTPYVDENRLRELRGLQSSSFDLTKLAAFCDELNRCWTSGCVLVVPVLVRAILDHVPPIFGQVTFQQVAGQHGTKSFKETMAHLENVSRKIADSVLHTAVRRRESLPNSTQIDFRNQLDVLLGEVVRVLRK